MTFNRRPREKLSVKVKGLLEIPIPYLVRVPTGDWRPFFTIFEQQSFGRFETDSCWMLSSINCAEANLNWLWKNGQFSTEAKNFFFTNGYCTADGIFSLSERFHEILCGNGDSGGTAMEAWQSFQKRGFIPRSQLAYSVAQAKQWTTQKAFVADYFAPGAVTGQMEALGQQSLQFVNISYQRIGEVGTTPNGMVREAALKQAPLNYGIPVNPLVWNQVNVPANTDTETVHEVAGTNLNPDGSDGIADQYQPFLKVLANGYWLGGVIQGVITAIPNVSVGVPQTPNALRQFWMNAWAWFNNNPLPFPNVPIGGQGVPAISA